MAELAYATDMADLLRRRNTDPATSHAAARRVKEFDDSIYELILSALKQAGNWGFTVHAIADASALTAWQVNKRLPELERAGKVKVLLDEYRQPVTRLGPSGRACRVWVAV